MSLNYGVVVVVVDGAAGPVKNPYAWPELTLRCLFPPVIAGFFRSHGFAVIFSAKLNGGQYLNVQFRCPPFTTRPLS